MDFTVNETQALIRDTARQFSERVLAPRAADADASGEFPLESLREAADLGLLGINVPEELGGVQAGAVAYSLAATELGRGCAGTTVAITVSNMVAEVIVAFGTPEQRALHVPRLCGGENIVGGFALSEAGAGSDPAGMTTRATKTDRGWLLSGSKMWITSGTHAKLFVVWARTSEARGSAGISCFLVDGDAPGVRRGKAEEKLGQHASTTTTLDFDGVELGDDALLGEEGRGFRIAMMALDGGRIGIGSLALGIAQSAHEHATRYATERRQFGRAIAGFQAIQWMIADSEVELQAARALVLRAAALKESGKPFTREAAIAKLYASERAFLVCDRAIQILGGNGYSREYPVERNLRDVRVTRIYEGTSEIQRVVIARDILARYQPGQ